MASEVPPGFNPQVSLLSGGTTPILPVQGGGGSGDPPAGYNETQSLLEGGTGTIVAMKGGAPGDTVTFKNPSPSNVRVFDPAAPSSNLATKKKFEKYRIDQYKVPEGVPTQAKERFLKILYKQYIKANGNTEELLNIDAGTGTKNNTRPKFDICNPKIPPSIIQSIARKIHFVNTTSQNPLLWVVPPLNGSLTKMAGILKLIGVTSENKLKEDNQYLIFQAPFFAPGDPKDNTDYLLLFTIFLELKQANQGKVFMMNQITDRALKYGCAIAKSTYSDPHGKRLPIFFEPDILVFLKEKMLFRSEPLSLKLPIDTLINKISGMSNKSWMIRPGASKENASGYFEFVGGSMEETTLPSGPAATRGCPGYTCPEFIKSVKMDSRALTSPLALRDNFLYLVWSTNERLPYLKTKAAANAPVEVQGPEIDIEEEADEDEDEEEVKEVEKVKKIEGVKGPSTITLESEDEDVTNVDDDEGFKGTSKDTETVTVEIELKGYRLKIRDATSQVKEEWKKGVFTASEAELLNLLHLSPAILERVFNKEWLWELADFLETLSISQCYKDSTLLLASECSKTRDFLRAIYMDRFTTLLDIYTGKTGLKVPKRLGDSSLLATLMDQFTTLSLNTVPSHPFPPPPTDLKPSELIAKRVQEKGKKLSAFHAKNVKAAKEIRNKLELLSLHQHNLDTSRFLTTVR